MQSHMMSDSVKNNFLAKIAEIVDSDINVRTKYVQHLIYFGYSALENKISTINYKPNAVIHHDCETYSLL